MESNKLGKKIHDWATNLGFTLPDGSGPPQDHFALLTATPHRRQLWQALVEAIQPRRKIEHMRKQILVAKLLESKKYSESSSLKQIPDRFDLWHKQKTYEAEVKEKRNSVIKLERTILTKASDSLFEIFKVSELEKQFEELTEKSVILKLLLKRKRKIMDHFQKQLLKANTDLDDKIDEFDIKANVGSILNTKDCCSGDSQNSELHKADFCDSGLMKLALWDEVIQLKRILIDKYSKFLEDVYCSEKNFLSDNEREIEKKLNASIGQLKQKTTEKSLQMIMNSRKGNLLDEEVAKLEEGLLGELGRTPEDSALNESFTYLVSGDANKPADEIEKTLKNVRNYLSVLELQKYQEFLKEELKRIEEEINKSKRKDSKDGEEGVRLTLKAFECVVEEINSLKSEEGKIEEEIFRDHAKLETLLRSLKEEMEGKAKTRAVEEMADKFKSSSMKQVDLLLDIPFDVFRTVGNSSGRIVFECESASHYLNSFVGEVKLFLSAMLIPPVGNVDEIISEVERRKTLLGEIRNIASEREKLTSVQKKIQQQLSSIKYDTQLCEKNFVASEGILSNVLCKTDELLQEVDFIEKILNNWMEQPYRSMIRDSVWGQSLKEAEEKYAKGKNQ